VSESFPSYTEHDDADCYSCGMTLIESRVQDSGNAPGRGRWARSCIACAQTTYYDCDKDPPPPLRDVYRLRWWVEGADAERPGGPWWWRDYTNESAARDFLTAMKTFCRSWSLIRMTVRQEDFDKVRDDSLVMHLVGPQPLNGGFEVLDEKGYPPEFNLQVERALLRDRTARLARFIALKAPAPFANGDRRLIARSEARIAAWVADHPEVHA
jgi:hypothetical protein